MSGGILIFYEKTIQLREIAQVLNEPVNEFKSTPSAIDLDSLRIAGEVWFGPCANLKGRVTIEAKVGIKFEMSNGVVLTDKMIYGP